MDLLTKNIIIIPYRDRKEHLEYFLEYSYPKLNEKLKNLEIIIVEQNNDHQLFNRGKLLNIGYAYCADSSYIYFTHDVDTNPINDIIFEKYQLPIEDDEIQGIYTSDSNTLGGIIKFKGDTFKKINGFPNDYFGWGVEDKALQNRAEFYKLKIVKFIKNRDPNRYLYFKIFENHARTTGKNLNKCHIKDYFTFKDMNPDQKEQDIKSSGLNNLNYKILNIESLTSNIIKIVVEI